MKLFVCSLGVALALSITAASAATVQFASDGVVTSSSFSGVNSGDTISFVVNFDDGAPIDIVPSPTVAFYNITAEAGSALSVNGEQLAAGHGGFQVVNDLPVDGLAGSFGFLPGETLFGQAIGSILLESDGAGTGVVSSDDLFEALTNANDFPKFTFDVFASDNITSLFSGTINNISFDNGVSAVPLPASGLLLLVGLGGLAVSRRFKNTS